MISVDTAEKIILNCNRNYGTTSLPLLEAGGRVLAASIFADRDLPPFNRVAMDGIAIRFDEYEQGQRDFIIAGVLGAGEPSPGLLPQNHCFEIMTGAALPPMTDTVVPYEHLQVKGNKATIIRMPAKGQNVHRQGSDKKQGDLLIPSDTRLGPVEISVAASVGQVQVQVHKAPSIIIFSSGNELVGLDVKPLPYQIRRSNSHLIHSKLLELGLDAQVAHLPDDLEAITNALQVATKTADVILLSGGVSMGKFDYIPKALERVGVNQLFHKVQQRPGKPFWFGTYGERGLVFALPGNPVSTFLCLARYVLPWLAQTLHLSTKKPVFARLAADFSFEAPLQYFLQVKLEQDEQATYWAIPQQNKGSGDYASLLQADAFMELPADKAAFKRGEVYRVWTYR